MKRICFLLFLLAFSLSSFENKNTIPKTLVIAQFGDEIKQGDTLFVPYSFFPKSIDDTLKKYLGKNASGITTLFIAQPSEVIKHIDFSPYTNLKTLILAGNDEDGIDSLNYGFFEIKKLKLIIASNVYLNNSNHEISPYPFHHRFRKYVNAIRPDIRVKFKVKFETMKTYNKIGWP